MPPPLALELDAHRLSAHLLTDAALMVAGVCVRELRRRVVAAARCGRCPGSRQSPLAVITPAHSTSMGAVGIARGVLLHVHERALSTRRCGGQRYDGREVTPCGG